MRTVIVGGARSGKSGIAESLLLHAESVRYVATARPWIGTATFDADFAERIRHHRERRPRSWITEDTRDLVEVLHDHAGYAGSSVLVDDLGTWLTHRIDSAHAWNSARGTVRPHIDELVEAVSTWPEISEDAEETDLVLVTPEVGMGVIPESHSGRLFRDELGFLNAEIARVCERVVFVVAGQPLIMKGPALPILSSTVKGDCSHG